MEENINFSRERQLEEKGLELIIPFTFETTDLSGCLALGKKMSGQRFSRGDLGLLLTMSQEFVSHLERIRLHEEVLSERAEKEKLNELNRLKTEFISIVSHELRTPMTSIQGLAEIIQRGKVKGKAKQDELLELMASESGRLSRFLHNILDFSRIEQKVKKYSFQKTEIKSIIEEVVKLFQYRLEKDCFLLEKHLPPGPVFLDVDPDGIKQVMINLLDNAIKYSAERKEIEIELIDREKQVDIQVKDKGVGIPPEVQKAIFNSFFRGPGGKIQKDRGVGLGLSIARHIMDAHHGEIRVDSLPGKGSTFALIFSKP